MGGVHTPVALHELQAIHDNQLFYLGPWAVGTSIVDNGYKPNYVFRLSVRNNMRAINALLPNVRPQYHRLIDSIDQSNPS